jgi:hypothetical protein
VTAVDVLQVINELNKAPTFPPAGEGSSGGGSIGGGGTGGSANGEADSVAVSLVSGKNLATQYYSQNPLQVLQIPGSAGCTCAQCTAIADVAAGRVSSAASPKTTTPVVVKPLELQSFAEAKKSASVVAQAKASAVHIDGSLLHTIASASGKPMVTIRRGRK